MLTIQSRIVASLMHTQKYTKKQFPYKEEEGAQINYLCAHESIDEKLPVLQTSTCKGIHFGMLDPEL